MADQEPAEIKIQIKLDEETAQGVYANMAVVNHSDAEFILDFLFVQPQARQGKVRSRVITSPRHVKRLIRALEENLARYEKAFGPVPTAEPQAQPDGEYH